MPHIDLTALVQLVGYPGIFLTVFLESGLPIGFFLPGASMLFTAGLLASQGFFNPWILIPLVAIAAMLGDNVGYWFGAKVGIRLFLRPNSRFFKHEHLKRAELFYEKYGAQTILLARFVPIVRTFAPIVAGIARMNYKLFFIYNVIGALMWGAGVTFLGYYLGDRFPIVKENFTLIVLGIIVVTSLPLVRGFWNAKKLQEGVQM